jgi:hypothetical protein
LVVLEYGESTLVERMSGAPCQLNRLWAAFERERVARLQTIPG